MALALGFNAPSSAPSITRTPARNGRPLDRLIAAPKPGPRVALRVMRPMVADHQAEAVAFSESSLVVAPSLPGLDAGAHVWVELSVADAPLRVLAQVLGQTEGGTHLSVRHLWPKDEARFKALAA